MQTIIHSNSAAWSQNLLLMQSHGCGPGPQIAYGRVFVGELGSAESSAAGIPVIPVWSLARGRCNTLQAFVQENNKHPDLVQLKSG